MAKAGTQKSVYSFYKYFEKRAANQHATGEADCFHVVLYPKRKTRLHDRASDHTAGLVRRMTNYFAFEKNRTPTRTSATAMMMAATEAQIP